jgi:hypothetical protein
LEKDYEWDPKVAQLKDMEITQTATGWNKFQVSLCIIFNIRKLFLNFVQRVFVFLQRVYP